MVDVRERSVRDFRASEAEILRPWLRRGARVLEIGGGNGFQAALIASWGHPVESIDVAPPNRDASRQYYSVARYDGEHIPYPDGAFDLVFSSNVLEHVKRLPGLLAETRRVLSADGLGVHIVPSASWRFWTSGAHYVHVIRRVLSLRGPSGEDVGRHGAGGTRPARGPLAVLRRALLDGPHGEFPSALHELIHYRRRQWARLFAEQRFTVVRVTGNGLFYTGCQLVPEMPMKLRRRLARVLGSACHVFVLERSRSDGGGTDSARVSSP